MSALIGNPLLLTSAPAADDDSYKIEKSLRFNHSDSPDLRYIPAAAGSRKIWTFSAWIKRHLLGNDTGSAQVIFVGGDGSNGSKLAWSNDTLHWTTITSGSVVGATATTAVFRDTSAWYHVVVAHDTTQSETSERFKIYVNGKLQAQTTSNTIEQDQESHINGTFTCILGGSPIHDGGQYCAMSMTDVYLIDGAALNPAAFGSFDSKDVWNPKDPYNEDGEFTIPTPNDGTTWSDTSGAWINSTEGKLFDGNLTGANDMTYPTNTGTTTITTGTFTINQGLRIYNNHREDYDPYTYILNDTYEIPVYGSGTNSNTFRWTDLDLHGAGVVFPLEVTSLKYKVSSTVGGSIAGIEVDGKLLIDGQTDSATWDRKWTETFATSKVLLDCTASSCDDISDNNYNTSDSGSPTYQVTAPTNSLGITKAIQLDGSNDYIVPAAVDLSISSSTETTIDVSFYLDSTHTEEEGYIYDFRSTGDGYCMYMWASQKLGIIGASGNFGELTNITEDTWHHLRIQSDKVWYDGTLTSLTPGKTAIGSSFPMGKRYQPWNGKSYYFKGLIGAFRILPYKLDVAPPAGGEVCVNGVFKKEPTAEYDEAHSFNLKFDDITKNRYLGKDTFHGKLAGATGGLPIYETSDDYGDVKGSGYRADSSAGTTNDTGLVLAVPGDSVASGTCDVHQAINTGSSNKAFTNGGTYTVSTDQSRLYGSSLKSTGTQYGSFAHDDDFHFGNGNFTVECWAYCTNNALGTSDGIIANWDSSGNDRAWMLCQTDNEKFGFMWSTNGSSGTLLEADTVFINSWHHIAAVRNSNTISLYIDGVLNASATESGTLHDNDGPVFLGKEAQSSWGTFEGYINDLRVYKGVAKYTANFTAPNRNDFTVNNLQTVGASGTKYSEAGTWAYSPSGPATAGTEKNAFDGSTSTSVAHDLSQDGYVEYTFPSAITVSSKLEVDYYNPDGYNIVTYYKINSEAERQSESPSGNNHFYSELKNSSGNTWTGSLTKIRLRLTRSGANSHANLYGIKVDGNVLLDGTTDAGKDISTDTPVNSGTDAGAGAEVTGNFCTWSPVDQKVNNGSLTLTEGNLTKSDAGTDSQKQLYGTMGVSSGKWYYEVELVSGTNNWFQLIGWANDLCGYPAYHFTDSTNGWAILSYDGKTLSNDTYSGTYATSPGTSQALTMMAAIDVDAKKVWFGINGTWGNSGNPATGANPAYSSIAGTTFRPASGSYYAGTKIHANFGQRAWKYTAPSGFKALCTQNFDDLFDSETSENNPSSYFDVLNYTGTAAVNTIGGLNFQPELIWIKNHAGSTSHSIYDTARGQGSNGYYRIESDTTDTQADEANLTAITSDGFTLTSAGGYTNGDGANYTAWCWDAGTAASGANNNGSINISAGDQWVNATAGFSITKYVSNNTAGATVGHGLNAVPELIIIKNLEDTDDWSVYHKGVGNTKMLKLNTSAEAETDSSSWNNTSPDANVFTIGNSARVNDGDSNDYIAYCWTPIVGYSAFGAYIGNVSSSGPFIHCGFKPKYVLLKGNSFAGNWNLFDTARSPNQPSNGRLFPNANSAQANDNASGNRVNICANGFQIAGSNADTNNNGSTFVYAAFAEHPFKTARAS